MIAKITKDTLLSDVQKALVSMSNIAATQVDEAITAISKEGIPFCLVTATGVYLRSDQKAEYMLFQGKKYGKANISPSNKDDFLQAATQSYWLASGKWGMPKRYL